MVMQRMESPSEVVDNCMDNCVKQCFANTDTDNKYAKQRQERTRKMIVWGLLFGGLTLFCLLTMTGFMSLMMTPQMDLRRMQSEEVNEHLMYDVIKAYMDHNKEDVDARRLRMQQLFAGHGSSSALVDALVDQALAEDKKNMQKEQQKHEVNDSGRPSADKYVQQFLDVVRDEDCMSGEFDLSQDNFDAHRAMQVFRKCKLLVIRNAFDKDMLRELEQQQLNPYLSGLKSGRISKEGYTSNGESYFFAQREQKRYEILLPRRAMVPDLVRNPHVMDVLRHPLILDDTMVLHSAGINLAEPDAVGQSWHFDEQYLFEPFETTGVGGHDMGAYAVTMMVPLLDVTRQHGPTEFCMGSSALQGLPVWKPRSLEKNGPLYRLLDDKSLLEDETLRDFIRHGYESCPPSLWRSPTLNKGDILLFDYQLQHRGSWNSSPETRAIMFMTYSRTWFKDTNFRAHYDEDDGEFPPDVADPQGLRQMLTPARFSVPESWEDCHQEEECQEERDIHLTHYKDFVPGDGVETDDEHTDRDFNVSNKDVGDDVTKLFKNGKFVRLLPPGKTTKVRAKLGDVFALRSMHSHDHKSWNVNYHGQIVFSSDM